MLLERNQIFKACDTIGWGFYSFFFFFFFFLFSFLFLFDSSFGQAGVKKKKKVNLLHQLAKETGCLSGQLYIRVLDFP